MELADFICGLGMLCKGGVESKLRMTMMLYDLDGSGEISRDEMKKMVSAFFCGEGNVSTQFSQSHQVAMIAAMSQMEQQKVDDEVTPKLKTMLARSEVNVDELVDKVFDVLDINHDNHVSMEEMRQWVFLQDALNELFRAFL